MGWLWWRQDVPEPPPGASAAVQVGWRSRGSEGVVLHLCLALADGALVAPGFLFFLVFRTPFLLLWTCCGCRRPRPPPPSPICFQNTESSAVFQFRNRALRVPLCGARLGCRRVQEAALLLGRGGAEERDEAMWRWSAALPSVPCTSILPADRRPQQTSSIILWHSSAVALCAPLSSDIERYLRKSVSVLRV